MNGLLDWNSFFICPILLSLILNIVKLIFLKASLTKANSFSFWVGINLQKANQSLVIWDLIGLKIYFYVLDSISKAMIQ